MATEEEWTNFIGGNLPKDMAKVYIYKTEVAEGEFLRKLAANSFSGMILTLNPSNDEIDEAVVVTDALPTVDAERWTKMKEFDNVSKLDLTQEMPEEEEWVKPEWDMTGAPPPPEGWVHPDDI